MELHNRTKIIATLGPASRHPEVISELIKAGADCFRINFSHTDGEHAAPLIRQVRQVSEQLGRFIPVLADIQGPKLRIGKMPAGGVLLRERKRYTLTTRDIDEGDDQIAPCQYEQLPDDVKPGTQILLADGTLELQVESIEGQDVHCTVVSGGRLFSNKGMNLPRTKLSVQTLTEKDRRDLEWISSSDVDIVAISFVRSPDDLDKARSILGPCGIPVMAKLELPEVLDRLEDILETADGVMVARGDLAVEVPFEQVPTLQERILRRAAARGKWAIVATQMLGSMVLNQRPTRAEVSDVANAVMEGADAIMLSEETAAGNHPLEAVQAMSRIAYEAEQRIGHTEGVLFETDIQSFAFGAANAAVGAARRLDAKAIIAMAGSGRTALAISKWRPPVPVLALSVKPKTLRRLNVLRGVEPIRLEEKTNFEQMIAVADRSLIESGIAGPGDVVVIVAAMPLGEGRETNTIRFHHVRPVG
jgi:pyruvate kinase